MYIYSESIFCLRLKESKIARDNLTAGTESEIFE